MNLDKTASALNRINRLFELISEMGEASDTERDLLKAYVKDLYNSLTDNEGDTLAASPAPAPVAAPAPPTPPPPAEALPEAAVAEAPPAPPVAKPEVKPSPATSSPALEELFATEAVTELSDKLSLAPISDLTKAMGLNERIFTVNELFGGDNAEFQTMITSLNGLSSFDEAKSVLMRSVAQKYDWGAPGKVKKAKTFIKLVQRRYK